ncbi:MAG TPA: hypothetical protein VLQ93_22900, partial [Myxococcaceae bacterium]|nr:hypothetical protein [Myxococcaceae bacterium]
MKRKRLGAVLPALVALLLVLASPRGVWASEVPRGREAQWRQQVQATGRAPLERNTRASLRRALEGLQRGPFRLA